MIRSELNERLKDAGLSKKDFAEKSGMSYGTVNNWGNDNQPVPGWVSSWLDNYKKSRKFDIIHKLFNEEINREKED